MRIFDSHESFNKFQNITGNKISNGNSVSTYILQRSIIKIVKQKTNRESDIRDSEHAILFRIEKITHLKYLHEIISTQGIEKFLESIKNKEYKKIK